MAAVGTNKATSLETREAPWWVALMMGIVNVILGIMLLTTPITTVVAIVWVLGIYWVIQGIFTLVSMFIDHSAWGWKLFAGLLSIIAGVIVLRYPLMSAAVIPAIMVLMLGIQGVMVGLVALVLAFKGGGLLSAVTGILSIVFGGILIANFSNPGTLLAFVWVIAIFWLVGGVVEIFQAFRKRTA